MWTKSNNDFALGQTDTNDSNGSMIWSHEKKVKIIDLMDVWFLVWAPDYTNGNGGRGEEGEGRFCSLLNNAKTINAIALNDS